MHPPPTSVYPPVATGGRRRCPVVLLPEEPAGLVSTRGPAAAEVRVRLLFRDGPAEDRGALRASVPRCARLRLEAEEGARWREARGTLAAMSEAELGEAIGAFLRAATVEAALLDAVAETGVRRVCGPCVPSPAVVGALGRLLASSGIRAGFGRVWTPLPVGAAVGVGVRGIAEEVSWVLAADPGWEVHERVGVSA